MGPCFICESKVSTDFFFLPSMWNTGTYSDLAAQRCSCVLPIIFFIQRLYFLLWRGAEESFCGIELWLPSAALDVKSRTSAPSSWAQWPCCSLACRQKYIKQQKAYAPCGLQPRSAWNAWVIYRRWCQSRARTVIAHCFWLQAFGVMLMTPNAAMNNGISLRVASFLCHLVLGNCEFGTSG